METSVAALTVNVVEPLTPLKVAEIDALPTPLVAASPREPVALLMVATALFDAQVTWLVMSTTVLSE